jgi:hypothetical protein
MQPTASPATSASTLQPQRWFASRDSFSSGLLAGLIPLACLIVLVALTLLATLLVRLATAGQGFAAQQQLAVIVLSAGLIVAGIVYAVACVRMLRRVGAWQRAGASTGAAGALWALGFSALCLVLPLLFGALLPQHPSPLLPAHPLP